jgi:hypothetical protein
MKRIIMIWSMFLLLGFLLINYSMAENDSVIVGPYMASFDIDQPHSSYNITVKPPQESNDPMGGRSICYLINIEYNSSDLINALESGNFLNSATIQITSFTFDPKYVTGDAYIKTVKDLLEIDDHNVIIKTDKLLLDGQDGAILSYETKLTENFAQKEYVAAYIPSIDSHALVSIDSTYPWDEGTSQLLRTIHIQNSPDLDHIDRMADHNIQLSTPNL